MPPQEIAWQIPKDLYRELLWAREFRLLQRQIRATGGFNLGETQDEIIANLREARRQIFEEEYAHLYQ